METVISILLIAILFSLSMGSFFCGYYFWLSHNGKLRKIMIAKYISSGFLFLTFSLILSQLPTSWIDIPLTLVCLPYVWQKARLIRYLISNLKK
jgi:hypothetical protein